VNLDGARTFDKDTLLRHLLHHLTMEQRRDLMREYPAAYCRITGREVVAAHYTDERGFVPDAVTTKEEK